MGAVAAKGSRPTGLLLAVALLAATTVLVNRVFPGWAYPLWNAAVAAGLVLLALRCGLPTAAIGLGRATLRRSALVGLAGVAVVAVTFGFALAVPPLRTAFYDQRVDVGFGVVLWAALVRIPLGTVLLEEVAFRGVLPALLGGDERWRWWPVLGASGLFGLWHVLPSLSLAESNAALRDLFGGASPVLVPVLAVLASVGAGLWLCMWRYAGRGLLAPILVHLATNSGGALLSWWLQSQA